MILFVPEPSIIFVISYDCMTMTDITYPLYLVTYITVTYDIISYFHLSLK